MNQLWNVLMRPILEKINAKNILVIGSDLIKHQNILEYCTDNKAYLTIFDPSSKFDIKNLKQNYNDNIEIYTESSITTLLSLRDYDVIIFNNIYNSI